MRGIELKAALYARVSTSQDAEKQNPENQLFRLREFAKVRKYDGVVEYIEYASGADPRRPILVKMLEAARHREFDDIIVTKLDRIMRSTINLLEVVNELNIWNIGLVCLDQPIETKTAMGRMVITIIGAVAEFERELIRERTNDGVARAKAEGRVGGRPSRIIDMAPVLKLHSEGKSLREISALLDIPYSTLRERIRGLKSQA